MLKLRNIVIIFIVMLVAISVTCMIIEANLVTNAARTATSYVQIAAECALKSATMTDEFFTSGTTEDGFYAQSVHKLNGDLSISDTAIANTQGLLIDLDGDDRLDQGDDTNIYALTFGLDYTMDNRDFAEAAYLAMFDSPEFGAWAEPLILNATKWSGDKKLAATMSTRPLYWTDTFENQDNGNWAQGSGVVFVPKLLTMGADLFSEDHLNIVTGTDLYKALDASNVAPKNTYGRTTSAFFGNTTGKFYSMWVSRYEEENGHTPSNADKALALLDMADYWNYKRTTSIGYEVTPSGDTLGSGGEEMDYYYTPTSLGLTYLNQDMVDILFRSNLDLLMRCSYLDGRDLVGYTQNIQESYYPTLDEDTYDDDWGDYAVNNGQFYYFRGKPTVDYTNKLSYTNMLGSECKKPEIEYYYVPISDGSKNAENGVSTIKNLGNISGQLGHNYALKNTLYRAVDATSSPSNLYTKLSSSPDVKTYEIVIAKVTFYADFIYPYKTSTLRGMAHWWGNPALGTGIAEQEAIAMGITGNKLLQYSGVATPYDTEASVISGSTQYKYTTYYAIAV